MLELKSQIKTPNDIMVHLWPQSPIYREHPVLMKEVVWIRLKLTSNETLIAMCRQINTNIDGLMDYLERERLCH